MTQETNQRDHSNKELKDKIESQENMIKDLEENVRRLIESIKTMEQRSLADEELILEMKDEINKLKNNQNSIQTNENVKISKNLRRKNNRRARHSLSTSSSSPNNVDETDSEQANNENVKINPADNRKKCIILGDSQARNMRKYIENQDNLGQFAFNSYVGPGAGLAKVISGGLECWSSEMNLQNPNQ
ncbi:Hypothetical predicted protein, partial [Olea europaea subsp. europaea]